MMFGIKADDIMATVRALYREFFAVGAQAVAQTRLICGRAGRLPALALEEMLDRPPDCSFSRHRAHSAAGEESPGLATRWKATLRSLL